MQHKAFETVWYFQTIKFSLQVQLEFYSITVPLQQLFYFITFLLNSQDSSFTSIISASELQGIFSTQQSNEAKYLNGDCCSISQSFCRQKCGSRIVNSPSSLQSCQNPGKCFYLSLMLMYLKCISKLYVIPICRNRDIFHASVGT